MEASDNKSKHISNGVKSILLIGIILVMVLVGCATQVSSSSGDFTIVNNTKYTLNINYQGPDEGWIPLTSIAAGKSWTGKRPPGNQYWHAYGGHINRCVFNPISPWVIQ